MRLDLVLKQSGIIKRRTIAKALAENDKVYVNERLAKPSTDIKEGDVLTLHLGGRVVRVEIHFETKFKKEIPSFVQLDN